MSTRPRRQGPSRRGNYHVTARGVRRRNPDVSRLMQASLQLYLASQEKAAEESARSDGGNRSSP